MFSLSRVFRLVLFFSAGAAHSFASSVIPPTFDELVSSSDVVVRGEVIAVRSEMRSARLGEAPMPFTLVTFRVDRAVVGEAASNLELAFLGGAVGDEKLFVSGQPDLKVGDREILFVQGNGRQLSPLVAMAYGRYSLVEDSGREIVVRDNGEPLLSVEAVSEDMHEKLTSHQFKGSPIRGALSVSEFETQIKTRAAVLRGTRGAEAAATSNVKH